MIRSFKTVSCIYRLVIFNITQQMSVDHSRRLTVLHTVCLQLRCQFKNISCFAEAAQSSTIVSLIARYLIAHILYETTTRTAEKKRQQSNYYASTMNTFIKNTEFSRVKQVRALFELTCSLPPTQFASDTQTFSYIR